MEPEPEPEPPLGAAQQLSGLWRAKGKTMRGGRTEEFLQLDVSASGVVTGMVDSDGDGVWTEDDCKIAPGTFDAASGALAFVQIYAEPELLDVRWSARYDAATDTLTGGEWATDGGPGGTFRAARTTDKSVASSATSSSLPRAHRTRSSCTCRCARTCRCFDCSRVAACARASAAFLAVAPLDLVWILIAAW